MARPKRGKRNPGRITYLKEWRKHRGLSQEKLADKAGLTQGFIWQLEKGATDYTGASLLALARALDCTDRDLLYRPPNVAEGIEEVIEDLPAEAIPQVLEILRTFKLRN